MGRFRFQLVPDAGPFFAAKHVARGAAFGDLDNDGDIDVVVCLRDGPAILLLNIAARVAGSGWTWSGGVPTDRRLA